jgi:hypothetical protein
MRNYMDKKKHDDDDDDDDIYGWVHKVGGWKSGNEVSKNVHSQEHVHVSRNTHEFLMW